MAAQQRAVLHVLRRDIRMAWVIAVGVIVLALAAGAIAVSLMTGDGTKETTLTFTADDNGGAVTLRPEQEFVIRLASNATTGYSWDVDALDVNKVAFLGSTYSAPSDGLVGQGGSEDLRFKALREGQTTLALKYWQPWSGETSVAERFGVTVNVEAGGAP